MKRKMSVAGSFYPALATEIEFFFEKCNTTAIKKSPATTNAIIVPHAGYIYSGFTANTAYRVFAQQSLSNIVVIGPSHRAPLHGMSICEATSYETPLGDIPAATGLVQDLKTRFSLAQNIPHVEHSTEVQFPFIKHYLPKASIVEIIYGRVELVEIQKIIEYALSLPDTGVIISSDLSHFYTQEEAHIIDARCIHAIETLDVSELLEDCEACGLAGIAAMLASAHTRNLTAHVLDYRTSSEASGDTTRVVGYLSAIFV